MTLTVIVPHSHCDCVSFSLRGSHCVALTVPHSQAFETALALDPNYLEAQLYLACALGDMLESEQVSSDSASR